MEHVKITVTCCFSGATKEDFESFIKRFVRGFSCEKIQGYYLNSRGQETSGNSYRYTFILKNRYSAINLVIRSWFKTYTNEESVIIEHQSKDQWAVDVIEFKRKSWRDILADPRDLLKEPVDIGLQARYGF